MKSDKCNNTFAITFISNNCACLSNAGVTQQCILNLPNLNAKPPKQAHFRAACMMNHFCMGEILPQIINAISVSGLTPQSNYTNMRELYLRLFNIPTNLTKQAGA